MFSTKTESSNKEVIKISSKTKKQEEPIEQEPYYPELDFRDYSNVYDIVQQEAYFRNLPLLFANVLIDSESSFRANAHNSNKTTYDSGPAQLNNKGEPFEYYMGKTLELADGRKVKVTRKNYSTDVRLNVAIGLERYKYYLTLVGNDPFAAYAIYNVGPAAERVVKKARGPVNVITALRKSGNSQGADNIKNNYWVKFKKWEAKK